MTDYHIPVLLTQSVDALNIVEDGIYVDVTYGAGSHSRKILNKLGTNGKLIAFDQDQDSIENLTKDERLIFVDANFRYLENYLDYLELPMVDGILADLGVSSHQLDEASRGFSYRFDADLDMRMNQEIEMSAADILNNYSEVALIEIFSKYGEVRNAKTLAKRILLERKKNINWTSSYLNQVLSAIRIGNENKYFAQVYQALRIEVNEEMKVLEELLVAGKKRLKVGGRFSVISYHSIEDRIVKNFFKTGSVDAKIEKDDYGNIYRPFKIINKQVITADEKELKDNSRAKSGKLRIAEKK